MKKAVVVYYAKGKGFSYILDEIANILAANGFKIEKLRIETKQDLTEVEMQKDPEKVEITTDKLDCNNFDVIIIATTVFSYNLNVVVEKYIREYMINTEGKNFAILCKSIVSTNALKKIKALLAIKKAKILYAKELKSIFEVNERLLKEAKEFAETIVEKTTNI